MSVNPKFHTVLNTEAAKTDMFSKKTKRNGLQKEISQRSKQHTFGEFQHNRNQIGDEIRQQISAEASGSVA
jgi:hypothetical protein